MFKFQEEETPEKEEEKEEETPEKEEEAVDVA